MKDHTNCHKSYVRSSKAWYADSIKKNVSVTVGMFHKDGSTSGEFIFEWIPLNGELCAKLKSFEDSWSALWRCQDLLEKMSELDSQNIQEPEFCELLNKLGYQDITEYDSPHVTNDIKFVNVAVKK